MSKTAIVLGATGLTGGLLTELLIKDSDFTKIKLFTRSKTPFNHPKVEEISCDLLDVNTFKNDFTGDVVFCCIGTTAAKTPDKELYKKIDYGIPVHTAQLASNHGIQTFIVMSSLGANASSSTFYTRVKGEMERDVLKQKIPDTYILQPSLIGGDRNEKRPGEFLFKQVMKVLNFVLIGPLKKYRSVKPDTIARSMILLSKNGYSQTHIESDIIQKLGL